ncbi:hypothetical protein AKG12_20425 [Agrobacterium sp. SUL3]|nr:hypothetical protein AKG12_20425 [Agrobacterium sp. SUL3]
MVTLLEKQPQPFRRQRNAVRCGDAAEIKAKRKRFLTNEIRQLARAYPLLVAGNVDGRFSRVLICDIYMLNAGRSK